MKDIDLIPIFSRIIVERKEVEKIGSIFMPANTREMKATEGEVIEVGDKCEFIKKGDTVFYGKYSGFELDRCGKKIVIMNEEDVIARVK